MEKRFNNPNLTASGFFSKYEDNDKEAKVLLNEVVGFLAHGIYSIICLLDPHKLVLCGGVINNNPLLLDLIKKSLKLYLIPEQQHSLERLFTSKLKGDSGIVGAGLKGIE